MEGLRKIRVQKGMTQAEMAQSLGIARNTFSQYECGKREPKIAVMKKMAELLGCTVDEIL